MGRLIVCHNLFPEERGHESTEDGGYERGYRIHGKAGLNDLTEEGGGKERGGGPPLLDQISENHTLTNVVGESVVFHEDPKATLPSMPAQTEDQV